MSGRVAPWKYPKPVSSFIFRNDSDKRRVKFTDVTAEVAPDLKNIGMVCDGLVTDFDNDNQPDLILAGEWMPITFLKNVDGKFKNVTSNSGLNNKPGWWNSIIAGDFRHTGRTDYIVGNVGLNTLYRASDQYPVYITAKDFDNNGGYEAIPSLFLKDQKGQLKEFPAHGRDDVVERLPAMKKRFNNFKSFATATMEEIFPPGQREGAALPLDLSNRVIPRQETLSNVCPHRGSQQSNHDKGSNDGFHCASSRILALKASKGALSTKPTSED